MTIARNPGLRSHEIQTEHWLDSSVQTGNLVACDIVWERRFICWLDAREAARHFQAGGLMGLCAFEANDASVEPLSPPTV